MSVFVFVPFHCGTNESVFVAGPITSPLPPPPEPQAPVALSRDVPAELTCTHRLAVQAVWFVPPRASASVPVVIFDVSSDGTSAATSARNDGTPLEPFGVMNARFGDPLAHAAVNVPEVDTGLPLTENSVGMDSPTLLTVPPDAIVDIVPFWQSRNTAVSDLAIMK